MAQSKITSVSEEKVRGQASQPMTLEPLPRSILDRIFQSDIKNELLGKASKDMSRWDTLNGIYTTNSNEVNVLLGTDEGIRIIINFLNNPVAFDASDETEKARSRDEYLSELIRVTGENISIVRVAGLRSESRGKFKSDHFGENRTRKFVSWVSGNARGGVTAISVPTAKAVRTNASPNHPESKRQDMVATVSPDMSDTIKAMQDANQMIDASLNGSGEGIYVVDPNTPPNPTPIPVIRTVNGEIIVFDPDTDEPTAPQLAITSHTLSSNAAKTILGSMDIQTASGQVANQNNLPGASFFPLPHWLQGIQNVTPVSRLVILVALLSKSEQDKYVYSTVYHNYTSVIDNEELKEDLYGNL